MCDAWSVSPPINTTIQGSKRGSVTKIVVILSVHFSIPLDPGRPGQRLQSGCWFTQDAPSDSALSFMTARGRAVELRLRLPLLPRADPLVPKDPTQAVRMDARKGGTRCDDAG
jgi:hypothetical protein